MGCHQWARGTHTTLRLPTACTYDLQALSIHVSSRTSFSTPSGKGFLTMRFECEVQVLVSSLD